MNESFRTALFKSTVPTSSEFLDEKIDVVIGLADGTNLKTCLFVFTQVIDLGIPALLAVTMSDEMERKGMELDVSGLSESLGVPITLINGRLGLKLPNMSSTYFQLFLKMVPTRRCKVPSKYLPTYIHYVL